MISHLIVRGLCLAVFGVGVPTLIAADQPKFGYKDTPIIPGTKWHVHDGDRLQPRVVTPGKTFSQEAGAPADAVVLFGGENLAKWQGETGEALWKVENGYMETTRTGRIRTKDEFGDFQLHLEFATPSVVEGTGQGRGNNGVLLHHKRELLGSTPHRRNGTYDRPHPPKGYLELYEHGNPVRFRNIWIRPLGEYDQP